MIEKRTKDIVMIIFATVLTILSLWISFTLLPNPGEQRSIKLDHQRVSDLGQLQYSIEGYYLSTNQLPQNLDMITTNRYNSSIKLIKNDPETNEPYQYRITSNTTYELCATFATDSQQEPDEYDTQNYTYNAFKNNFQHPIGTYCFSQVMIPQDKAPLLKIIPSYIPEKTVPASKSAQ